MMTSAYNESITAATLELIQAKKAIHETIDIQFEGNLKGLKKEDLELFANAIRLEERRKRLSKYLYLCRMRKKAWKESQLKLW